MTSKAPVVALVRARLPGLTFTATVEGDVVVFVTAPEGVRELAKFLHHDRDAGFDAFVDVTVVQSKVLLLVVCLASRAHNSRVQIRATLDDDDPVFPTLTGIWRAAWSAERELWEMFGVTPLGHPSLRRALLPESFAGHPLLERYRIHKAQPQVTPSEQPARVVIVTPTGDP
ncbi:MAG: NADH-quinone oxidoreductase subunit C [Deltaproteobacteria bacterium]|nr:NADH-quinone oxidoreductase subunit C [Deltaproteobacteria bacterium]